MGDEKEIQVYKRMRVMGEERGKKERGMEDKIQGWNEEEPGEIVNN